jgi:very-short-patch-repair endonuclease
VRWQALRGEQLDGLRFRRQHSGDPFVLDFWCPLARLVIEVDGAIHADEDQAAPDADRTAHLAAYGYRVLRVTNDEVPHALPAVLNRIRAAARRPVPPA